MAQKLYPQKKIVSNKNISHKKAFKKTKLRSPSLSKCDLLSEITSPQLPVLLPFLSSNRGVQQNQPTLISPFVLRAPSFCFEDGSGYSVFGEFESGEANLMDKYHPLGDVLHKRVRFNLLEMGNSSRCASQPQHKKIRAECTEIESSSSSLYSLVSDLEVPRNTNSVLSSPISELGVSMSTCVSEDEERSGDEDGIISDGCEERLWGMRRRGRIVCHSSCNSSCKEKRFL